MRGVTGQESQPIRKLGSFFIVSGASSSLPDVSHVNHHVSHHGKGRFSLNKHLRASAKRKRP